MENLNFELHEKPTTKHNWKTMLIIAAIIIGMAFMAKLFYDKYQRARIDIAVEKKKADNSVTKGQIVEQEAKQAESNADFKADQKASVKSAKEIQKERSTQKKIENEKPEIIDRDYDFMRSVIDSARAE